MGRHHPLDMANKVVATSRALHAFPSRIQFEDLNPCRSPPDLWWHMMRTLCVGTLYTSANSQSLVHESTVVAMREVLFFLIRGSRV